MTAPPANPLLRFRDVWNRKPVLREVYADFYRRMAESLVSGPTLEVGGGSGNFKDFASDTVASDILYAPWLDVVCDAQQLPFADGAFANLVMVDVIHHVEYPLRALREAARVLRPGGRLIFCEPAITPLSTIFYRLFHEEPVDMSADPLIDGAISPDRDPYDSNQAIPTLLVGRYRDALARAVPQLELTRVDRFAFMAYPLSGGFQPWQLLPTPVVRPLLSAEWAMRGWFGRLAAFRLLAVLKRRG